MMEWTIPTIPYFQNLLGSFKALSIVWAMKDTQGKSKPHRFAVSWNSKIVWIWGDLEAHLIPHSKGWDTSTFLQECGSSVIMDIIKY